MKENEQKSRLLLWSGRLAFAFLLLLPLSVLAVRLGLVHYRAGLGMFALSCLGSLLVLVTLTVASLLPRYRNQRRKALLTSLAALPPVLLFGALLGAGGDYPPIHDVSTDPDDPPVFTSGAIALRGEDSNSVEISPDAISAQLEHYPDLATIQLARPAAEVFEQASAVAESLGWEIHNSQRDQGLIEAAYTSFWFGFVDDVVIRIRPADGGGSEIDLRSVSRVGIGDLGANANRIRAFSQRLREQ